MTDFGWNIYEKKKEYQSFIKKAEKTRQDYELQQLAQQHSATITIPQDVALQVCFDIRQELQTQLLSTKRVSCAMCMARGQHNLPHKLANSSDAYCSCPTVARRYALNH